MLEMTSVYPSGSAAAPACAPTAPPAPPRFSMKNCCRKAVERWSAMMRPSVSAAPPAANGAMILTGRFGQLCACAGVSRRNRRAAAAGHIARSLNIWEPSACSLVSRETSASAHGRHGASPGRDKWPALCAVADCNLRLEELAPEHGTPPPRLATIDTPTIDECVTRVT